MKKYYISGYSFYKPVDWVEHLHYNVKQKDYEWLR